MRALAISASLGLSVLLSMMVETRLLAQVSDPPRVTETAFELAGGGEIRYGISIPAGYDGSVDNERPLILALHPGGRSPYYGSNFMQSIVEPALRSWEAVIVAPDVPTRSWANAESERAVLDLLEEVLGSYAIDHDRILVTGFSMGGRGTWYLATRHADLFTGAIPIAASRANDPLEGLEGIPVHLIHSPDDEVVPYGPAEATVKMLEDRGHPVQLISLEGASHYQMGDYIAPLRAAGEWMRRQWQTEETGVGR